MRKLFLAVLLGIALGTYAEKRIYFTYAYARLNALPVESGLTTVDYRIGPSGTLFKMNNWDNMSGPWSPTSGSYTLNGNVRYHQYGFATTKTTFSVIHALVANTTTPLIADLSEVTKDWTFHIAIKTNYVGKLEFIMQNKNGTQFKMDITSMVPNRTGVWNKVEISMDDFITATGIDFADCVFTSTETTGSKRDMWIVKASEVTASGDIGWDDCYLTNNDTGVTTNINSLDENSLIKNENYLQLSSVSEAGITVYSVTGATLLSTKETLLDISSLKAGLYIAKSGNSTLKFIR